MLKVKKYYSVEYFLARLKLKLYEIRHPEAPWLPSTLIDWLSLQLKETDIVLEWGSGRSTKWFSKRVSKVCSVEHDVKWYDQVKAQLGSVKNVELRLSSLDQEDSGYTSPEFSDCTAFDVVLIDGRRREACFAQVLQMKNSPSTIIIDNADRYLISSLKTPCGKTFNYTGNWKELFELAKKNYTFEWFENGVTASIVFSLKEGKTIS